MKDTIGLYCNVPNNNTPIRGCYKVVINLVKGLKELGIEVKYNTPMHLCGCLQGVNELHTKKIPKHALIGPEIMVFPDDIPNLWGFYKYWTQPSQWVIDNMKTYSITNNNVFYSWPVGIDTDMFNGDNKNQSMDCFVYYKDVNISNPVSRLNYVKTELNKRNIKYTVIEYGKYKEHELINAIKQSKFGILLTGTESQGIAYMEMLSSNVPLFVFNQNYLTFRGRKYKVETNISSVPYFDSMCGIISNELNFNKFDEFLSNINNYKPRDYILENHTLKKSAEKYYNILQEITK
jgi:hypothetical protein